MRGGAAQGWKETCALGNRAHLFDIHAVGVTGASCSGAFSPTRLAHSHHLRRGIHSYLSSRRFWRVALPGKKWKNFFSILSSFCVCRARVCSVVAPRASAWCAWRWRRVSGKQERGREREREREREAEEKGSLLFPSSKWRGEAPAGEEEAPCFPPAPPPLRTRSSTTSGARGRASAAWCCCSSWASPRSPPARSPRTCCRTCWRGGAPRDACRRRPRPARPR
jgi:hypothetical protein